jgi:hypothetical protein
LEKNQGSAAGGSYQGGNLTATGVYALQNNSTGFDNVATGVGALRGNTKGYSNTATGLDALYSNTTGFENTATGVTALYNNTTGYFNVADGYGALYGNTTGYANTAVGLFALEDNSTGTGNTAAGFNALWVNTTGGDNTAVGADTISHNTTGGGNTAVGALALEVNTTGAYNTVLGGFALSGNTTGGQNTALGSNALQANTSGNNNVALGYNAGSNLTIGNNNIDIANTGVKGDTNSIRIGTQGTQTAAYIAGISGAPVTGSDVIVNGSGRLGVMLSSARFKRDISDMGAASDSLMKLRPVTFRYKDDPAGIRQFGLIAEEVEQVYPELVTHAADGKLETVRYSVLTAMLLNELQKQTSQMRERTDEIKRLSAELADEKASRRHELDALKAAFGARLASLERAVAVSTANHNATAMFDR